MSASLSIIASDARSTAPRLVRVAACLLLLYAQSLVRVAQLRTSDVVVGPAGLRIRLGREPAPVPEPFAALLREHLVRAVPAPVVATQLGYSQGVTHRHAALAAQPMARYSALQARRLLDREG